MRNRKMGLMLLLGISFGFSLVLGRYVTAKSSSAEVTKQKWEYCHLFRSYSSGENQYKAQVLLPSTPNGRIDEIESDLRGMGALNKLGAEGWEVVGIIPNEPNPEYILKRLKS
jgi:hypothetical protein